MHNEVDFEILQDNNNANINSKYDNFVGRYFRLK